MPGGKPAGVRCIQLDDQFRCQLYGKPERPEVCVRLRADLEMCGSSRAEALVYLTLLEHATDPRMTSRRHPGLAGREAEARRDRDPTEPEEQPGSRAPVGDPESPVPEPHVDDPLDAPGAGDPDRHDPDPQAPPRGEPP
jgi:hypothetical protein